MGTSKNVLGLDIGSNSIGFSLLKLSEENNEMTFENLTSNSIVFTEPFSAKERRDARSSRRSNERKSNRNRNVRNIFIDFNIADKSFLTDTTNYLNNFKLAENDVYNIRKKAIFGTKLTKKEFILATYSILTNRGYCNMFSISDEDSVVNEAVMKNSHEYSKNNYKLPSMVLTKRRENFKDTYHNFPIRNKKDDYHNSLNRDMHVEEFEKVVLSQANNKDIFKSAEDCENFISKIIDSKYSAFYQRPIKSFENMVEFCSFYDKFNPNGSYKKTPLSNVKNIELTLRQNIDNNECIDEKTGEIKTLNIDEIDKIIDFWVNRPSSKEINATNIFKSAGLKNIKLNIGKKSSQVILNIQAHKNILEVLNKYKIDFQDTQNEFYNELLLVLYYFKNIGSRVEQINHIINKHNLNIKNNFTDELAKLQDMSGFASFSLEFTCEVLDIMKNEKKIHSEALESIGYNHKYLNMPAYSYLPPLNPNKKDIEWLEENDKYFDKKHLFYQPMVSPKVKRVISILRKLINKIIKEHGKIDEIRIETTKEMNSKNEKEKIIKNQNKHKDKNSEAKKFLINHELKESKKNIDKAKLWKEQGSKCLYSGEYITKDDAFDEDETEVEHFIPRSVIWINSYKNKILVKKKYNRNKSSLHPVEYLKSIGEWANFQGRVQEVYMDLNKKDWLTKEDSINSVMKKEHWQKSYLNDTRSAIRTIQKYLNHYLYPNKNAHNKGGKNHIFCVSGRAVNELKYMWGIHKIMPKNKDNNKDRNTNYHHTLDAFVVALCSSSSITALHSYFKDKENKFKIKALNEKINTKQIQSKDGVGVVKYLKQLVEKYEKNELHVCPYNKRKTNIKGFKDSNLKLYITENADSNEMLAEIEKVSIDKSILNKIVNGFPKPKSDKEVLDYIKNIQNRLDTKKQKKIICAIEIYANKLIDSRSKINVIEKEIKKLSITLKKSVQHKEHDAKVKESIKLNEKQNKILTKELQEIKCSFSIKNNKRQIVKCLRLKKIKIEKTKADVIIFKDRVERLSIFNFKKALSDKEPFVIKMNESTLNVKLFNTKNRGQAVGLNYFSSISNDIKIKINNKFTEELKNKKCDLVLYKNDIIKVDNPIKCKKEYYVFNGGGNVSGGNNKLSIKNININSFAKINKKGEAEEKKEDRITPNKAAIVSIVKIDFFGNIIES
ncbi:MAG: type II CRISPR RNA-guided endonuclease Cas9 [Sulfurospirillum sp.]|nr:type II CRISPR RNA-guided endonuclease Cas9 [Sulfurospirillum sp.]